MVVLRALKNLEFLRHLSAERILGKHALDCLDDGFVGILFEAQRILLLSRLFSMKTLMAKTVNSRTADYKLGDKEYKRNWYVVDAADVPLGRAQRRPPRRHRYRLPRTCGA